MDSAIFENNLILGDVLKLEMNGEYKVICIIKLNQ